jgi:hypothetical protein
MADAASGRPRSRGPAAPRPTYHQAQRLARWSSGPEHASHRLLRRPGAGRGGWPGAAIWLARSKRSEAQRSGAQRCARAAGQFVKRDRRSRTRDGHQGPRSPAAGRAAFDITAGSAGHAVLRQGWKPVQGRDDGVPQARRAARQPDPRSRGDARLHRITAMVDPQVNCAIVPRPARIRHELANRSLDSRLVCGWFSLQC